MAKVGLVLDTIDAETIDRHEREAFIGFHVDDGCDEEPPQTNLGDFGTSLPTAGDTASVHANEAPRAPAEEISSDPPETIQFSDCQPANDDDDGEEDNFILPLRDK